MPGTVKAREEIETEAAQRRCAAGHLRRARLHAGVPLREVPRGVRRCRARSSPSTTRRSASSSRSRATRPAFTPWRHGWVIRRADYVTASYRGLFLAQAGENAGRHDLSRPRPARDRHRAHPGRRARHPAGPALGRAGEGGPARGRRRADPAADALARRGRRAPAWSSTCTTCRPRSPSCSATATIWAWPSGIPGSRRCWARPADRARPSISPTRRPPPHRERRHAHRPRPGRRWSPSTSRTQPLVTMAACDARAGYSALLVNDARAAGRRGPRGRARRPPAAAALRPCTSWACRWPSGARSTTRPRGTPAETVHVAVSAAARRRPWQRARVEQRRVVLRRAARRADYLRDGAGRRRREKAGRSIAAAACTIDPTADVSDSVLWDDVRVGARRDRARVRAGRRRRRARRYAPDARGRGRRARRSAAPRTVVPRRGDLLVVPFDGAAQVESRSRDHRPRRARRPVIWRRRTCAGRAARGARSPATPPTAATCGCCCAGNPRSC